MAKYRQLHTSFWSDGFILDLTPEEKYFYLYIMTNSKTSQCGIFELPLRVMETETGYNRETIEKLLKRFTEYGKLEYSTASKEIIVKNWIKYNPPNNGNTIKCINSELKSVKNVAFTKIYIDLCIENGIETEEILRGLQGAMEGLPSNKVISNKEEVISNKEEVISNKDDSEESIPYQEIFNFFNFKVKTNYKATSKKNRDLIKARVGEGFRLEHFKAVIDKKVKEWTGTEFEKFLRPETLFGTKFESYLNQKINEKLEKGKKDNFNNYDQRSYDFKALEKGLLGQGEYLGNDENLEV